MDRIIESHPQFSTRQIRVGANCFMNSLNCNLFNADFPAPSDHIPDANLRVFLSEVRPKLRSISINARRSIPRMPERPLQVAEVGTWESKAFAWHRRGFDLQGIGILHHGLSKRFVQRGSQEGVSYYLGCWRKASRPERRRERSFACPNKAITESPGKRNRLTISLGSMGCQFAQDGVALASLYYSVPCRKA